MTLFDSSKVRNLPDYLQGGKQASFNPYSDNGGSILAIGGNDFCIIGADTRLSTGYQINTRNQEKLFQLSNNTILGCAGCWCDTLSLTRILAARMQMYKHEHQKEISTPAAAQMLSIMLYYKRFFPYYISNLLAGLDEEGKGCVYKYDVVGNVERVNFSAAGSSGALLQPLLDNQVGYENQENVEKIPLTVEKALKILKDVFTAAAERDIYTGDSILIKIITKQGVKSETFELRKD
ncbi:proteasome subunit beta type-1 [Leptopilina heterotoma]|uniref:proteasome subunit beta type-1 n=1 Tax=Leptopilina heterotoma TaxID=63436 RepID=UPI001CA80EC3|nr:proteasome subunit beta type-1 [Leptopilina heterotoma]